MADQARAQTPPGPRMPDLEHAHVPGTPILLWSLRNTQIMLELNHALFSIARDRLQHQQEALAAAAQRSLQPAPARAGAANDDGFGFARLGIQAFNRIMATMQRGNNTRPAPAADGPAAAGAETSPIRVRTDRGPAHLAWRGGGMTLTHLSVNDGWTAP